MPEEPRKFAVTGYVQPAPPQRVTVSDVAEGRCDNARVRFRARVINVQDDTIEPNTVFLHLTDGTNTAIAAYWRDLDAQRLIDAEVEVDGLVMQNIGQWRRFQGRGLINYDVPRNDYVKVVVPPPADPFAVPEYSDRANVMPQDLAVHCIVRARIKQHLNELYTILGAANRTEAVAITLKKNIL